MGVVRDEIGKLLRFGLVGGVATVIHVATALALLPLLPAVAANLVAFTVAFGVSYVGHQRWSFGNVSSVSRSLPRFLGTTLLLVAANNLALFVLLELRTQVATSLTIAACVVPLSSYLMSRFWAFLGD